MYRFEYTLSDKDFADFNEYHLKNDSTTKKTLKIIKPIPFAVAIIIFVVNFIKEGVTFISMLLPCIVLIAAIIWLIKFDDRVIKKTVKKAIDDQKKSGKMAYSPNGTVTFTEDMIIDKTETIEQRVNYSEVIKIANTDNALYVYITPVAASILPKSLFKSDNELNEFLSFLNEKCEKLKG